MGHLATTLAKNRILVKDGFNGADSTTTLGTANTGQTWTALTGTWGISGNRAYSASDTAVDIATIDVGRGDFNLFCTTNGQTVGSTNNRYLSVIFRLLDSQNLLFTRVNAGGIQLFKTLGGATTQIASTSFSDVDNTDYGFMINCSGNQIRIYVDGVIKISYTLTGGDTVFAGYTKVGLRLSKGGAPTGTARADNFLVEVL